jgi:hypothetical protein
LKGSVHLNSRRIAKEDRGWGKERLTTLIIVNGIKQLQ